MSDIFLLVCIRYGWFSVMGIFNILKALHLLAFVGALVKFRRFVVFIAGRSILKGTKKALNNEL